MELPEAREGEAGGPGAKPFGAPALQAPSLQLANHKWLAWIYLG